MPDEVPTLEDQLNDFDPAVRRAALAELAARMRAGEVAVAEPTGMVNVHYHTFFSFNYRDWSPSRIVWEAKKLGLDVAGAVDFDVLDAMGEMFEAGDVVELRTNVALETRVYAHEFADKEFSAPGEPGVLYFMGTGYTRLPAPGSEAEAILDAMRAGARARNEAVLERLRPILAPVEIDYETEVMPLGPSGSVTERHMLGVFQAKAEEMFPDPADRARYWSERTGLAADELRALFADTAKFRTAIRAKLMKRGGPGYQQPDETTFPPVRDVVRMTEAVEAIPCATWLDGTRAGEEDAGKLADWFLGLGCLAYNMVPDRNWNIADPAERALKVRKLGEAVAAARERDLIFSVGTEMNNYGQKFVDTFDAPELRPFWGDFRDGATILYGHTLCQRALGKGRMSPWARHTFGDDRARANGFYLEVGRLGFPPHAARAALAELPEECSTRDIIGAL